MQLLCLRVKDKHEWKYFYEPQGELIGSIAEPQVYQAYLKAKKKQNKAESVEDAMAHPEGDYGVGLMSASSEYHFDPTKGLVDSSNNIVIPKDEFEKEHNLGGIAISY